MSYRALAALAAMLSVCAPVAHAQSVNATFTYQGQLKNSGAPTSGIYDMTFAVFTAQTGGSQVGSTLIAPEVVVTGGLFNVKLDFGMNVFDGQKRWLEVGVKPTAASSYTTLTPRQELTAAPYAWTSERLNLPFMQVDSSSAGFGTSGLFHVVQEGAGHAIVGQTTSSGAGVLGICTSVTGNAARFWNMMAANDEPAIVVAHSGTGWGVSASSHGGRAGSFEILNANNPNIALYGYTAGTGHGVQGYSISSGRAIGGYNNGTGHAGYFRIGNEQSASDAVYIETIGSGKALSVRSIDGPAIYARSSGDGPALQTDGGGLKVTGAGINSNTWVYIHQSNSSNTSGVRTYLNNQQCNGNPNAIILVTNAFNGGSLFPSPVAVGYESSNARWYLHDMDNEEMSTGRRFNIMIVVP